MVGLKIGEKERGRGRDKRVQRYKSIKKRECV